MAALLVKEPTWTLPIVHVNGLPGSGKTGLAKRLGATPYVVSKDLDDIWDENARKLMAGLTPEELKALDSSQDTSGTQVFFDRLKELCVLSLRSFLDTIHSTLHKTHAQIIVLVGVLTNVMDLSQIAQHKLFIEMDTREVWRRLNLRTLDTIYDNYWSLRSPLVVPYEESTYSASASNSNSNATSSVSLLPPPQHKNQTQSNAFYAAIDPYPLVGIGIPTAPPLNARIYELQCSLTYGIRLSFPIFEQNVLDMKKRIVTQAVADGYTFHNADSIFLSVVKLIQVPAPTNASTLYVQDTMSLYDFLLLFNDDSDDDYSDDDDNDGGEDPVNTIGRTDTVDTAITTEQIYNGGTTFKPLVANTSSKAFKRVKRSLTLRAGNNTSTNMSTKKIKIGSVN